MEEREEKDMAEETLSMGEGRRKSSSFTPFLSIYQNLISY